MGKTGPDRSAVTSALCLKTWRDRSAEGVAPRRRRSPAGSNRNSPNSSTNRGLDLGLPNGAIATLAAKSSAQNAYMVSCLLANHGFVYLEAPFIVQLLPAMLAAARGAVFNGIPPYDLWEHPPSLGKLPPHGSDAGSYLVGEVFGARSVILVKDVDGLYTADPKTDKDAKFIPDISVPELLQMQLATLPIEPVVLDLLTRSKLVKSVRIVNGLVPGNLSRALAGDPVGTLIYI